MPLVPYSLIHKVSEHDGSIKLMALFTFSHGNKQNQQEVCAPLMWKVEWWFECSIGTLMNCG